MIWYGDSWVFSYEKDRHYDKIKGKSIPELIGKPYECHAKRRVNTAEIFLQIKKFPCFVFQTDPLRDLFCDWSGIKHRDFEEKFIPKDNFGLLDVAKDRLDLFYSKLSGLDVTLVSGASKVDVELAEKYNLDYIEPSVTEIITGTFDDTPFFDHHYTGKNHRYLMKNYPQYNPHQKTVLSKVEKKNLIWKDNPKLFANRHATEYGNSIFTNYINNIR